MKPVWFRRLMLLDEMIDNSMYHRASGTCVCEVCGREFWRHPNYTGSDRWTTNDTAWLNLLCDGTLVHL